MLLNKKAFTLVELLGVIIILSLLVLIVLPNIVNSVRNYSTEVDDVTKELIYDAAKLYLSDYSSDFKEENGNMYCISLAELVDENYLKSPITSIGSNEDITNVKSVQVIYDDGYTYELKDIDECETFMVEA